MKLWEAIAISKNVRRSSWGDKNDFTRGNYLIEIGTINDFDDWEPYKKPAIDTDGIFKKIGGMKNNYGGKAEPIKLALMDLAKIVEQQQEEIDRLKKDAVEK